MALDPARLQSSALALRTAETAYDAALREQAAATAKLAAAPNDAAAASQLKLATQKVATTRTRVETARRALDGVRIAELATLDTGDRLLGTIAGDQVIGLFPVGVEAKLEAGKRLRVRVWPDAVSTSTHDPRLTQPELEAGQRYWRAEGAAVTDADRRTAWRELAETVGVTRAAWIARVLTPTNQAALAPGVAPVFPTVAMLDEEAPFVARASVLPDRWMVVGFRDGAKVFEQVGCADPDRSRRRPRHDARRSQGAVQPRRRADPVAAAHALDDRFRHREAGGHGAGDSARGRHRPDRPAVSSSASR